MVVDSGLNPGEIDTIRESIDSNTIDSGARLPTSG
jgi:hypothetical protein